MTHDDITRLQAQVRDRVDGRFNWKVALFWAGYGAIMGTLLAIGYIRTNG